MQFKRLALETPADLALELSGACLSCAGRAPLVHAGFAACYNAAGIKREILALVSGLFADGVVSKSEARVFTTGHSLGGALAALCAGALLRLLHFSTHCSFGLPTTGCPPIENGMSQLGENQSCSPT